ncbi:MAG: ABC transporter ATP-binding protein [Longimicrobiales bacterium]
MTEPLRASQATEASTSPATARPNLLLEARGLEKRYIGGDGSELRVLDGVDIDVAAGESVAIVGASGAGKSTLLHLLGGLDRASSGAIRVGGRRLDRLEEHELARVRNAHIGFVFQFHHLLREFTALENVMMPMRIAGIAEQAADTRARELLERVGLSQRLEHKSGELSGGEQQRVAVARALANEPLLLLADEPSGNLDTHTSERLHDLFFALREKRRVATVIATHNQELADRADRTLLLKEGRLHALAHR